MKGKKQNKTLEECKNHWDFFDEELYKKYIKEKESWRVKMN